MNLVTKVQYVQLHQKRLHQYYPDIVKLSTRVMKHVCQISFRQTKNYYLELLADAGCSSLPEDLKELSSVIFASLISLLSSNRSSISQIRESVEIRDIRKLGAILHVV